MTREKESKPLLPLTSDFVFKAIYGKNTKESEEALRAVLNVLLGRKDDPIEWVHCENPFILAEHITGKESILDIKCRLSSGQMIDLEMQVTNLKYYVNRSVFYMGQLIASSLNKGENYSKMKPTLVISIVADSLFADVPEIYTRYTLHERVSKRELTDLTQIHFLELDKIDITKPVSEMTPYERIGAFFRCADDDSKREFIAELEQYEPEVIRLTKPILEEVSRDQRMRDMEEAHDKYIRTLKTLHAEHAEALEEGREEGRKEGRKEGMQRTNRLTKMLLQDGRLDDLQRSVEDSEYQKRLFEEYGL